MLPKHRSSVLSSLEYRSLDAGRRNDYRGPTTTGDYCTTRPRHTKKDHSDVLQFPTTPLCPVGKGRNIAQEDRLIAALIDSSVVAVSNALRCKCEIRSRDIH
ncbi:unnamed protein product [Gadus morhua 'NCC']